MPYPTTERKMAHYREKYATDPAFRAKEAARKARWYKANLASNRERVRKQVAEHRQRAKRGEVKTRVNHITELHQTSMAKLIAERDHYKRLAAKYGRVLAKLSKIAAVA